MISSLLPPLESLDESTVQDLLDRLETRIPARERVVEIPTQSTEALVVGDTHGDYLTTQYWMRNFWRRSRDQRGWLIGLGDYVDRTPRELPLGSLKNAWLWITLLSQGEGRVVALRGNHETPQLDPKAGLSVEQEARVLWGPDNQIGPRLRGLLSSLPLAARTESGVYLAHAGFPRAEPSDPWAELENPSARTLWEVTWNDFEDSPAAGRRGIPVEPFTEAELRRFLNLTGTTLFLRGHDPHLAGQRLCGGRLLTIHSSRSIPGAGFRACRVPLGREVRTLDDLEVIEVPQPVAEPSTGSASGRWNS
jgi:hypothetical protein